MLKDGMPVIYANHSWRIRALTEVHVREFRVGREFGVLRPRISPEVWVADFAWVLREKGAQGAPFQDSSCL